MAKAARQDWQVFFSLQSVEKTDWFPSLGQQRSVLSFGSFPAFSEESFWERCQILWTKFSSSLSRQNSHWNQWELHLLTLELNMAQYVDTIKVLFPKFLLACFVGMQTWRQERQKTNKFTMGTSRQMTTLSHKTNPEAHTMLKDKLSVFPQFICMNTSSRNAVREENGECVAWRDTRGNTLIGLSKLFG